ncbi:MAG: amidohydrolase family protein [Gemmobacter sp.]
MCTACDLAALGLDLGIDPCHCGAPHTIAAYARLEADLKRREFLGGAAAVMGMFAGFGLAPRPVWGQAPGRPILLTNLRLFDGTTKAIREGVDILVEGDRITGLPAAGQGPQEAQRIDCGGRTVTPGLIETHGHLTLAGTTMLGALAGETSLLHLISGQVAGAMLMQGFTTVRDVGGPVFGLKMAIDRGIVAGPRVFPSGAMLSQTSGHGDFRLLAELPRMPMTAAHRTEVEGVAVIADGVPEVLRRTREQLMKGASQIKIMAGGGVSSLYDPLDVTQYTADEMRAAVQAAADWGTYVCAHVYTDDGIRRCMETGVKCVEHGQLAGEETVRMIADSGTWWSIQPFLADEDSNPKTDPVQQRKQQDVARGTERAFELARKYPVKMTFGTDVLFNGDGVGRLGRQLNKFTRYMGALDALHLATGAAGELLALSGPRAPYGGPLGVIAPGAFADILLFDGDLTANLDPVENHVTDLRLIMKGGRIVKDTRA